MAAPNELVQQYENWNARVATIQRMGAPIGPAVEVAKQDLQRIYAGGSPRSTQDITDQLSAAYTGNAQVAAPQASTGLGSLLGNAVHDFSTIITGLPGAVGHELSQIANPADWQKMATMIAHAPINTNLGEQARYDQTIPIIGGILPGLWTLGSSTKQKEQHPLQSFLDVLPFVTSFAPIAAEGAGLDAAPGTWQESLLNGKVAQAGIRAGGLDSRALDYINTHPGILSEFQNMPIWRRYAQIGRAATRRANAELYSLAQGDSILPPDMSTEEFSRLTTIATTYNDRYETPPTILTPSTLDNVLGRWNEGPGILPAGDIQAWSAGNIDVTGEGSVSLSHGLIPNGQEVRIRREDTIFTSQPGIVVARNIIPDITYQAKDVAYLKKVRDWVNLQADRGLTIKGNKTYRRPDGRLVEDQPPLIRVPTGEGHPDAIYSAETRLDKTYHRWQDAEQVVNRNMERLGGRIDAAREAANKLQDRSGKIRQYGETDQDFAARPNQNVDIRTIHQSAQGLIDYFAHLRPAVKGPVGDLQGLFAELEDKFKVGDARGVKSTLSRISRKMRTQAFAKQNLQSIYDYVHYLRDEMTNITSKGSKWSAASRDFRRKLDAATKQKSHVASLRKKTDAYAAEYWQTLDKTPEARFHKLADAQLRGQVTKDIQGRSEQAGQLARILYQGENLSSALDALAKTTTEFLDRVAAATRFPQLRELVGSESFDRMMQETVQDWRSLSDAGYDPIWLHSPDSDVQARVIAGRITPLVESFRKPGFERGKAFSLANGKMDIAVGVTDQVIQKWGSQAAADMVNYLIDDSGAVQSYHALEEELRQQMAPLHTDPQELNRAVQVEINRTTSPFQPEEYYRSYKTRLTADDHYVIDKTVKNGFDRLQAKDTFIGDNIYNRGMNVWRVAVLSGPRHLVHVAIGGLVFMLGQHPEAFTHAFDSFTKLRNGELPEAVTQGLLDENPDVIWSVASGKWMGNAFMQSLGRRLGSVEHALFHFEQFAADWQRGMVYLSQIDKGLTSEEALAAVWKTFVDIDNLTPFERTIVRQVFPFWTFTKHALRYVLTYPADHPVRAAILSSLVHQLTTDQKSGEPQKLSNLFFLGSPDASGNVGTVDFKNLNPFRSIGGIGTLAGFLQGANPAISIIARGLGYDPLAGVPMIYQPLTYDAYTGTDKPKRPGFGVGDIAEQIVPEVSVLDHFFGFTSQMRALKAYSPAGYQAALFNSLNLPFTYTTQNIYDIRARTEHNRYKLAEQAVSAAEQGNLSALDGFDYVPYQGYLFPARTVKAYLSQYAQTPGIAPKAIIPTPRRRHVKRVF